MQAAYLEGDTSRGVRRGEGKEGRNGPLLRMFPRGRRGAEHTPGVPRGLEAGYPSSNSCSSMAKGFQEHIQPALRDQEKTFRWRSAGPCVGNHPHHLPLKCTTSHPATARSLLWCVSCSLLLPGVCVTTICAELCLLYTRILCHSLLIAL